VIITVINIGSPQSYCARKADCLYDSEGELPPFLLAFVMWSFVLKLRIHHVFNLQSSLLHCHVDISAPAKSTYRCIHSLFLVFPPLSPPPPKGTRDGEINYVNVLSNTLINISLYFVRLSLSKGQRLFQPSRQRTFNAVYQNSFVLQRHKD